MQTKESFINQQLERAAGAVDSGILAIIFNMFQNEVLQNLLESSAHYVLFPLAALFSAIKAAFALYQAFKIDQGKQHGTIVKALIETAASLAITVAVVGGLAASAIFTMVSPIIFVATLGVKAVYHAAAASYYAYKAWTTTDVTEKEYHRQAATGHFVGAIAASLATVAVGLVMIAAKPLFAFIGVLAGVIGVSYSLHKFVTTRLPAPNQAQEPIAANDQSSTANISQSLGINPETPLLVNVTNQEYTPPTGDSRRKKSSPLFEKNNPNELESATEQDNIIMRSNSFSI